MNDDSFRIQSTSTIQLQHTAESLLQWCDNLQNTVTLTSFTVSLIEEINTTIKSSITTSYNYNREKLWRNYFILKTSKRLIKKWTEFIKIVNIGIKPPLYQHLTDIIFKGQIQNYFKMLHTCSTEPSEPTDGPTVHITPTEKNVLQYIAGYICRQLRKKIERTSHKLKEELILCLMDMTKDGDMEDHGTDEEWTDLMDRGGLIHVKDTVHQLICAIETEM